MYQAEANNKSEFYVRVPAKVLGCLRRDEITVVMFSEQGLVLEEILSTALIPQNLRMPNSEFDVLFKYPDAEIVKVLHRSEA